MADDVELKGKRVIRLHPSYMRPLRELGASLRWKTTAELFGFQPHSVGVFSDYAGDDKASRYETFVTYVVPFGDLGHLLTRLDTLRRDGGVANRQIDFKGRKDKLKWKLMAQWLEAFRDQPGLCIAICFDKTPPSQKAFTDGRKIFAEEARTAGPNVSFTNGERLARALCFLPVIAPLLRTDDRLLWVSDNDAILQGRNHSLVGPAFGSLSFDLGLDLAECGYCAPLREEELLVLSMPDLLAGTLAARLPHLLTEGRVPDARDQQADDLLDMFTLFPNVADEAPASTRLLIVVFESVQEIQDQRMRVIGLHPQHEDPHPR